MWLQTAHSLLVLTALSSPAQVWEPGNQLCSHTHAWDGTGSQLYSLFIPGMAQGTSSAHILIPRMVQGASSAHILVPGMAQGASSAHPPVLVPRCLTQPHCAFFKVKSNRWWMWIHLKETVVSSYISIKVKEVHLNEMHR